ncbi:hypothetical protein HR060_07820 [Catenovulum sp. SM1970]|nr:hypothetical protein [Marinifaba aquimaris]NTS76776.1 hypothetical protein [Marinifaba aquimaris]
MLISKTKSANLDISRQNQVCTEQVAFFIVMVIGCEEKTSYLNSQSAS